jgi:site-specific DNA-methyltransferase (adenine-specific)
MVIAPEPLRSSIISGVALRLRFFLLIPYLVKAGNHSPEPVHDKYRMIEKFNDGEFLQGECLKLMAKMPDCSVDMVLCDLPYGTTGCKWDSIIPFDALWREYWRVTKPNAAIVLTASQPFTSALVMSQPKAFKCEWIWRKNVGSNFLTTKIMPMKEHESVLIFAKAQTTYNPIKQPRSANGKKMVKNGVRSMRSGGDVYGGAMQQSHDLTHCDPDLRCPSSVQSFNVERGLHPTQKPVSLFEYLIMTYTNAGDTVLDNCAGSGTTAVAARNCGRRWICIEQDQGYFEKAVARLGAIK